MKKLIVILSVVLLSFQNEIKRPIHIFMIGDSTMANKSERAMPETGWGQVLHYYFNDSVVVDNHAVNGRSSKSFIDQGRWDRVIEQVQPGDYVIIQFGHNDEKPDEKRHTDPYTTFVDNLKRFINETKEKQGIPVLCTSIVRRHFNDKGKLIDTHGEYIEATRLVAKETGVYFIDMEAETKKVVEKYGPEKSKELFMFIPSGVYPNRNKGVADSTHLTQMGAFTFASLAINGMVEQKIPVIRYLNIN